MAKNAVTDWSTSAASNTDVGGIGIQGSSNISSGDNSFREIMAQIATQFGKLNAKGADLASGSVDLSTATGAFVHITGTTTITALGTVTAGRVFRLEFDAALTLTHNGTSLILPGGANITTAAGDTAEFISEGGGNWRCLSYSKASGVPVINTGAGKGSVIASASTISIGPELFFHVTGTTTITDIDFTVPGDGRWAVLEFDGILTLTHNATTLVLPGGANIITAAGDTCMVVQDSSDNIHVVWYQTAAVKPVPFAKLTSGTLSSSTTQAINLSSYLSAGYTKFRLHLTAIAPATDGAYLVMDVSANAGSSYLNSGYIAPALSFVAGTVAAYNSTSQTSFILTDATGNAAGELADAVVEIDIYSAKVSVHSKGSHITAAGACRGLIMEGFQPTSGINAVRFYQSSGNMASGSWELYGIK